MRLNIGCGNNVLPGYVNIDLYVTGPEIVNLDASALPYPDGSASVVLADDVLEHFPRLKWKAAVAEWVRVLAPGGAITIRFPDMRLLAEALLHADSAEQWDMVNRRIFGGQGDGTGDGAGMFHCTGFSFEYLRNYLEREHGLQPVRGELHNFNCTLTMMRPEK